MVSTELIGFMRKHFGDECLKILNFVHQRLNIESVDTSTIDEKKAFIIEMQPFLKNKSFTKSEIMVSELMSILNINNNETTYSLFGLNNENKLKLQDYLKLQGHRKIKSTSQDMDTMIKLYLEKTKEATKKGISKKQIQNTTLKVINGLTKKLTSINKDIENNFNIITNKSIIENKLKELNEKKDYQNIEKIEYQINLAKSIEKYNSEVNKLINEYKRKFIESINAKIFFEKENIPSTHITLKTKKMSEETLGKILISYENLTKDITNMN